MVILLISFEGENLMGGFEFFLSENALVAKDSK
jgi:hypothetical protein